MPSPACDQCHRRKQPCAGGRPACPSCIRLGHICTYSTGKPVGKPKGHKKNASNGSISKDRGNDTYNTIPMTLDQEIRGNDLPVTLGESVASRKEYACGLRTWPLSPRTTLPLATPDVTASILPTTPATWIQTTSYPIPAGNDTRIVEHNMAWSLPQTVPASSSLHSSPATQWTSRSDSFLWATCADSESSSAADTGASCTPPQYMGIHMATTSPHSTGDLGGIYSTSVMTEPIFSNLVQDLASTQPFPPVPCPDLSGDIDRLLRYQLNPLDESLESVLRVVEETLSSVEHGLSCLDCANTGQPRARLMSYIIALDNIVSCFQKLLQSYMDSPVDTQSICGLSLSSNEPMVHRGLGSNSPHFLVFAKLHDIERVTMAVRHVANDTLGDVAYWMDLYSLLDGVSVAVQSLRQGVVSF